MQITVVDIARSAGISDATARRILHRRFKPPEPRAWLRFDAEMLPDLVAYCESQRQRRRLNCFNAALKPEFQQQAQSTLSGIFLDSELQ